MRLSPFLVVAALLAGCMTTPEPVLKAAVIDEPRPPTPDNEPLEPGELFGFALAVLPPPPNDPYGWTHVTVGTLSSTGAEAKVRGGLNATVVLLPWDATNETYEGEDVITAFDAALARHNDTLAYWRLSLAGSGETQEFSISPAYQNATGAYVPPRSIVLLSPHSPVLLAGLVPEGGFYQTTGYVVIEAGKAQTVHAWGRTEAPLMTAPAAQRAAEEER